MYDPWTWPKGGNAGGRGWAGWRGIKGGKWDNCYSIINKIYLKEKDKDSWLRILSFTPTFMSFLILIQLSVIWSFLKQQDGLGKEDSFNLCSALYSLCDIGHLFSPSEPWLISVKMLIPAGEVGKDWPMRQKEIKESVTHRSQENKVFLGGSGQPRWELLQRQVKEVSTAAGTMEECIKTQIKTSKSFLVHHFKTMGYLKRQKKKKKDSIFNYCIILRDFFSRCYLCIKPKQSPRTNFYNSSSSFQFQQILVSLCPCQGEF